MARLLICDSIYVPQSVWFHRPCTVFRVHGLFALHVRLCFDVYKWYLYFHITTFIVSRKMVDFLYIFYILKTRRGVCIPVCMYMCLYVHMYM